MVQDRRLLILFVLIMIVIIGCSPAEEAAEATPDAETSSTTPIIELADVPAPEKVIDLSGYDEIAASSVQKELSLTLNKSIELTLNNPEPDVSDYVPQAEPAVVETSVEPVANQVVIRFQEDVSDAERDAYLTSIDATIQEEIDGLNSVVVQVAPEVAEAPLPESEAVVRSEPDYYVHALNAYDFNLPTSDPQYDQQWNLQAIGVSHAWAGLDESAPIIRIALLDSGICSGHADLAGKIVNGYDFVDQDNNPEDVFGHGCAVAGIIAAEIDNGVGIAGVAPNVQIAPYRVLDGSGLGTYSNVAAAVVRATDEGSRIINLSLGGSAPSQVLKDAIDYATDRSVTVIAATGNTGQEGILYPARYNNVIAVGSIDPNMARSSFSTFGAELDVLAPGRDILTTNISGGYGLQSGTSFAAPHVAGAIALQTARGQAIVVSGGILDLGEGETRTIESPNDVEWETQERPYGLRPGYVMIGDAAVPESSIQEVAGQGASHVDANYPTWPGGILYYVFDASVSDAEKAIAFRSMAEWESVSGVYFVPRTTQPNYVRIRTANNGNWSYIGMIGGEQDLYMQTWTQGIFTHELGHALTLIHEHQRYDRDTYVTIDYDEVSAGQAYNFDKFTVGNSQNNGAYDFYSIMHYHQYAFASGSNPTIIPNAGYEQHAGTMGTYNNISVEDGNTMNALYPEKWMMPTGTYEQTFGSIKYYGNWGNYGSVKSAWQTHASVRFQVADGNTVMKLYRTVGPNYGTTRVCVDGACQIVSNYAATKSNSVPITVMMGTGSHTVLIEKLDNLRFDFDKVAFTTQNLKVAGIRPLNNSTVDRSFEVSGLAWDESAGYGNGPGADKVRVITGSNCWLNVLAEGWVGLPSPGWQAHIGLDSSYRNLKFKLQVPLQPTGRLTFRICFRSSLTGNWERQSARTVTIGGTQIVSNIALPAANATVSNDFNIVGAAYDKKADSGNGPGVSEIRIYKSNYCNGAILASGPLNRATPPAVNVMGGDTSYATSGYVYRIQNVEAGSLTVTVCAFIDATQGWYKIGTRTYTVSNNPPENDAFDDAVNLNIQTQTSYKVQYNIDDATTSPTEPNMSCSSGGRGFTKTVWYRHTFTEANPVSILTSGSNYDTILAIYRDNGGGNLTEVGCNDDIDSNTHSLVSFTPDPAFTYYSMVGEWSSTQALTVDSPKSDVAANSIRDLRIHIRYDILPDGYTTETSPLFRYEGGWGDWPISGPQDGSTRYTTVSGNYAEFYFKGSSMQIWRGVDNGYYLGQMRVCVLDVTCFLVDNNTGPTWTAEYLGISFNQIFDASKRHRVRVEHVNGSYIYFDGVTIAETGALNAENTVMASAIPNCVPTEGSNGEMVIPPACDIGVNFRPADALPLCRPGETLGCVLPEATPEVTVEPTAEQTATVEATSEVELLAEATAEPTVLMEVTPEVTTEPTVITEVTVEATELVIPTEPPVTEVLPTATLMPTEIPPTATLVPTEVPPTATLIPTEVPPTATLVPTEVPPTATLIPTEVPPTATLVPTDIPPTATLIPTEVPSTATEAVAQPEATAETTEEPMKTSSEGST